MLGLDWGDLKFLLLVFVLAILVKLPVCTLLVNTPHHQNSNILLPIILNLTSSFFREIAASTDMLCFYYCGKQPLLIVELVGTLKKNPTSDITIWQENPPLDLSFHSTYVRNIHHAITSNQGYYISNEVGTSGNDLYCRLQLHVFELLKTFLSTEKAGKTSSRRSS